MAAPACKLTCERHVWNTGLACIALVSTACVALFHEENVAAMFGTAFIYADASIALLLPLTAPPSTKRTA